MLRRLDATLRRTMGIGRDPGTGQRGSGMAGSLMTFTESYPVKVDLHVQREALAPGSAPIAPSEVADLLRRRSLAGLVLTEHDALPDAGHLEALNRALPKGMRVFRAAEVGTSEGHCLVIGLPDLDGIRYGISTWDLVKRADLHGAAVVLVHPLQPTPLTPRPPTIADLAPGIHAIEVMSTVTCSTAELEARLYAHERGWTMVGGSDALSGQSVGAAFCALPRMPRDEGDLASLIRAGSLRPERAG